jgi:hypothetical protein
MNLRDFIHDWYEGEFVPFQNEPTSPIYFVGRWERRSLTARLCRVLVEFYQREWKWIIGTGIAIAGIVIALHRIP